MVVIYNPGDYVVIVRGKHIGDVGKVLGEYEGRLLIRIRVSDLEMDISMSKMDVNKL